MRKVLLMLLVSVFCVTAFARRGPQTAAPASVLPHDGSWWKEKSGTYKEAYLVGYKEGIQHAAPSGGRSVWATTRAQPLVEGLNEFHKDFRNANVYVDEALGYVQDELQGTWNDDALKAELQEMRQVAAARKE